MISVEIFISGEQNNHLFLINNEALDPQSNIANHVHQPFDEWKASIFDELAMLCNDYFTVVFHCTRMQFEELEQYAEECPLCRNCRLAEVPELTGSRPAAKPSAHAAPTGGSTDIVRQLDQLKEQGVSALVTRLAFGFYITPECEPHRNEFFACLAEHGFHPRLLTQKLPYFNIALEEIEADEAEYYDHAYFAFAAHAAAGTEPVVVSDSYETLVEGILSYIRDTCLLPFVQQHRTRQVPQRPANPAVRRKYSIRLPEQLFVGDHATLVIHGAKYAEIKDELEFVTDQPNVLHFADGRLTALSAGTASICFRVKGSLDDNIASGTIKVTEHVFVREITISQCPEQLYVGESFGLNAACVPAYADDADTLSMIAADPSVLDISANGRVTAKRAGFSRIEITAGAVCKTVEIAVKERLKKIVLPQDTVQGCIGAHIPFSIKVEPRNYTEKDLQIDSNAPAIATYQNGEIRIHGIGKADIILRSQTSPVQARVHVEGQSIFTKKHYNDIPVQIGIVLFLITLVMAFFGQNLFYVSIIGALLCGVSLFWDRNSRMFSLIFAVLNILLTYWLLA